ncbi:Ku protein [Nakamurella sp. YIM 132087]|uniref:Non-homologous end joining protein Ku n=1 Tax=Nakamurella alba TaxID=2665158 RepID=A0A7K1FNH9_9ACTN|nr:Ku protein [Nakamurella alba]MTD15722.1 Ku protein [Nakamurella alba]
MRSIWKGALSFGLVNVPIKVYSATEDHDVRFHLVHRKDGGRIRFQRVCEADGKVVEYADTAKAFESDDGRTVVLTDEDFDQLPENTGREIEVLRFVPSEQIDPVLFDRSYFLEPAGNSIKAYLLLRAVLEKTERTALVHFALRQKTRLAALRVRDGVLMVQTLLWPDEVREADFEGLGGSGSGKISAAEMKQATALVDSFAGDFDPADYTDTYREQLEQLIDAKLDGEEAFPTPEKDDGEDAEVLDLLSALKRSVERGKASGSSKAAGSSKSGSSRSSSSRSSSARSSSAKSSGGAGSKGSAAKKSSTSSTAGSKSTRSKSSASKSTASKTTASKTTASKTGAAKSAAAKSKSGTSSSRTTTRKRAS